MPEHRLRSKRQQLFYFSHLAKDLKLMDARIFRDEPMGIKAEIMAKNGK